MARKSETDLSRYDLTRGMRGKYVGKARRSFETMYEKSSVRWRPSAIRYFRLRSR